MLDFLGIGAQKTGTTWLYEQLRRHPEIAFPLGKEAHFWDREFDELGIQHYLEEFQGSSKRSGEITPAYALLDPSVIKEIRRNCPKLRLIYILRNPIERAWSSARMALQRAELRAEEASSQWFIDHFLSSGSVVRGDYANCLKNWFSAYSREDFLLLRFETIESQPHDVLKQCYKHLNVPQLDSQALEDPRKKVFAGPELPMPTDFEDFLAELYLPKISELESLLGESFQSWFDDLNQPRECLWPTLESKEVAENEVERIRNSEYFDEGFYSRRYSEALLSDLDPAQHYLQIGAIKGFNPSAQFDTTAYLTNHSDVAASGMNPLLHYECFGRKEGRILKKRVTKPEPIKVKKESKQNDGLSYTDFATFSRKSIFLHGIKAPWKEADLRVLGFMQALKKKLDKNHDEVNASISVILFGQDYTKIDQALSSVLNQDLAPVEIIVLHSKYLKFPTDWLNSLPQSVVFSPSGSGDIKVRGEFVAILDEDTRWSSKFLKILAGELSLDCFSDLAYCALKRIEKNEEKEVRFSSFSRSLLENQCYIQPGTVLLRSEVLLPFASFDDWKEAFHHILLNATECKAAKATPCLLASRIGQLHRFDKPVKANPIDSISSHLEGHDVPGLSLMHGLAQRQGNTLAIRPTTIIIPSYECLNYLQLCIEAVRQFSPNPCNMVVVDNGSSTAVVEYLNSIKDRGDTQVVLNNRNLGFSYAVNQGIELAAPDSDVVLLNNDAVVTPGWLEALQAVFQEVPDAGLAVSRQVLLPGTKTMRVHNPACDDSREVDVNLSIHHDNLIEPVLAGTNGLAEVSFAPFFCVYIPRSTLTELGPLDHENAPHYRSDRLYCEAVREIYKRKIIYTPHSKVYHFLQRATAELKSDRRSLYVDMFEKNSWKAISRH